MKSTKPYGYYMIISDLDGTIIPHGGVVSEANKRAIESFRAGGGHFGIATGRTPEAAAGYLGGVAITAPSVFFNGSMLYDWQHERVLVTKPLTAQGAPDLWPRFAALCLERFPKACIEVYTQEDCHIISNPRYDDPRLPHEHYRYCHSDLADLADVRKTPWLKFFVCADPADLRELEREAEVFGTAACSHHFYSEANYHEFVAKGVSKGSMLEAIRKMPAFSQTKIIALGDYLNDRELLEAADIGIASGNAHDELKALADFTGCRAEDDLIVWLLEHFDRLTGK
ncbi:HAD-IIB family hydrolase [Mitsuokella jalaludinii]|uniref:HAD-IIB family hydrolase n=2 Tax=Mitsuokella jalaludinii TaxID=187979 RepID=UPI001D00D3F5|nr:HAD family hydrolase [Mitsuokella jalaludinii]MCB5724795.1 Cof-type HAD-IIB family hydrolase [Mitsuokella jalaludinii]